jgi:hypothetical protein
MERSKRKELSQTCPIQCVWAILCSNSITDRESNNLSLINIIEQFNVPKEVFYEQKKAGKPLPLQAKYELVSMWRRAFKLELSNEEIVSELKIVTIDPNGKMINETVLPFKFPQSMKRLRVQLALPAMLLTVAGDYVHEIFLKFPKEETFKKVHEVPFEVNSK